MSSSAADGEQPGTEASSTQRSSTLLVLVAFATFTLVALGSVLLHNYTTATRKDELRLEAEKRAGYIDALAVNMEKKATELALNGETFYRLNKADPHDSYKTIIADFLVRSFSTFPEATGGGIWFEPYAFDRRYRFFGPYAYWKNGGVAFTWDLSTPDYDYTRWSWYRQALPEKWPRNKPRPQQYYWSPPYQDEAGTSALVVTVTTFMHDYASGEIIGITCVDWSLDYMLSLLEREKITPRTQSFLLDNSSGLILSLTINPSMKMHHREEVPWLAALASRSDRNRNAAPLQIDGISYTPFLATTHNGLTYGMLVPASDISGDLTLFIIAIGSVALLLMVIALNLYKMAVDKLRLIVSRRTTELLVAKEAAEGSARAKSRFLANMSHEIRTPLNSVVGFINLLGKTPLNTTQNEYLRTIRSSLDSLLTIINDILDFSRIESGKLLIHQQRFDLSRTINDIVRLFSASAENKGLRLVCDNRLDTPYVVKGDAVRLSQLLGNLLNNAIKFTEQGEVVLRVNRAHSSADAMVSFEIIDTGRGIDPSMTGTLFDAFEQFHSDDTRTGTGLGLAICKSLVEAMHGTIGYISLQHGTRFWVHLPLPRCEQPCDVKENEERLSCEKLRNKHLLLVDDVAINRKLITTILDQWDISYREASNGAEAIALNESESFDLILMDIRMPVMDGVMATRTIRQREGKEKHIPIIGLTAHAFPHELEEYVKAGMDASLTKPINEEQLIETLLKFLG